MDDSDYYYYLYEREPVAGVILSGDDKDSSATLNGPCPDPPWRSEAGEELMHRWRLGHPWPDL